VFGFGKIAMLCIVTELRQITTVGGECVGRNLPDIALVVEECLARCTKCHGARPLTIGSRMMMSARYSRNNVPTSLS